jgi:hypothetical protein
VIVGGIQVIVGVVSWSSREPQVSIGPPARTVGRQ